MAQRNPPQKQKERKASRRTLWFMILLLLLTIAAVAGISRYVLQEARSSLLSDVEQQMASQVQGKTALLTVWYGSIVEQTRQLVDTDTVRLFAHEAVLNDYDAGYLLAASRENLYADDIVSRPGALRTAQQQLGAQAPFLHRQFQNFILRLNLVSATLYNPRHQAYIRAGEESPSPELSPFLAAALDAAVTGGRIQTTPARLGTNDRLTMDLVQPVFAPLYTEAQGNRNAGALVFTLDVTDKIREISSSDGPEGTSCRILQRVGDVVQEIPPDGAPRDLPGWRPAADGGLPMDKRFFPGKNNQPDYAVFSFGMPVPGTAWLVSMDTPESSATANYESFRRSVILSAVLLSALAALVLFMLWWWLLGQRERAVAKELQTLYETVNQQKQILDGVNTTLADGIVLNDLQGHIPYANQAFTLMANETLRSITTKTCRTLTSVEVGRNILSHTEAVLRANTQLTFTDILHMHGQDRCFQVACTPFRNAQGGITGVVSVYRDISDLLNAQARAQHMVNQTVTVFVRATEAVDPYLHGHSAFTGVLAASLASFMGMEDHEATLRTAANLSQIGMIQLPRELLAKTDKLTPKERAQLQTHVEYARAALEGIDFGLPVLDAIVQMHERLDGSGYPLHLEGDAIGVDARILAVANTFCAVLRPRSYRQARGLEEAMDILSEVPPRYDPYIVQILSDYLATPAGQEFLQELCG